MPRGTHPHAYFTNPNVEKPMEEIYQDLDSFTDEVFEGNVERYNSLSTFILLPPLRYRGKFIKGILFSHGADLLVARNPWLKELFHVYAYSMWSSIPTSVKADGLFTLYPNPGREKWFKERNPERAKQVWLPLEDADFFDAYRYAPQKVARDVDVLCISRLDDIKNLPMFAKAIKILIDKEPFKNYRCTLICGKDVDVNWTGLHGGDKVVLRQITEVLGSVPDYLHVEPKAQGNLAPYYSRAKCIVLASLIEGKNRTIHEAASCDVPVVTFAQFNQYMRAGHPVMPEGAGVTAPEFTPESLAETIRTVLSGSKRFNPRQAILEVSGKKHVFNTCIDALPYYRHNLPGYEPGRHLENRWLDLALWDMHHMTVHQHLFAPHPSLIWVKGLEPIEDTLRKLQASVV